MIEVKSMTSKKKVTRILGVKIVSVMCDGAPPLLQSYFDYWCYVCCYTRISCCSHACPICCLRSIQLYATEAFRNGTNHMSRCHLLPVWDFYCSANEICHTVLYMFLHIIISFIILHRHWAQWPGLNGRWNSGRTVRLSHVGHISLAARETYSRIGHYK